MNGLTKSTARKPDVPEQMQARWQQILDLMARVLAVSAGAIMKVDQPEIEIFLSSVTEGNPFPRGKRINLDPGLY